MVRPTGSTPKRLSDLATGERARVSALAARGDDRRRLLDLGLVPGTDVEVAFRHATGDPTAYRFRGVTVALRNEDARSVFLEEVAA